MVIRDHHDERIYERNEGAVAVDESVVKSMKWKMDVHLSIFVFEDRTDYLAPGKVPPERHIKPREVSYLQYHTRNVMSMA